MAESWRGRATVRSKKERASHDAEVPKVGSMTKKTILFWSKYAHEETAVERLFPSSCEP
jgi:hypothetical protein